MPARKYFILFLLASLFAFTLVRPIYSGNCDSYSDNEAKNLCRKVEELGKKRDTLSSEIRYLDAQINLTAAQIQSTEQKIIVTQKEIDTLGTRIEGLDNSLDYLSKLLISKIVEGYKQRSVSLFTVLLDSINADDLINRIKYIKTTRQKNQNLLLQVQETKSNFEEQKSLREDKKTELDNLKITLDKQKVDLNNQQGVKKSLLAITEAEYAQAQAEYTAIQGIIAGGGTETVLRDIRKGDSIASVISGASCNSSGGHLHFIVQQNGAVSNPFNLLKSVDSRNCSGSSCGSSDGDPFNPSGNLDWPLNPTIELEQGYGNTWAVRNTWVGRIYNFHNGIDINGTSDNVIAIADGTLYRGSYAVGCTLSYTKLVHKDSNIITLYLHTYPL